MNSSRTNPLRIGELAEQGKVSPKTIRYYEEIGLLPQPERATNGYRVYEAEDIHRLRFIRNARNLEFSLDELKEVLSLRDAGQAPCKHVDRLLREKVAEIEERIKQLLTLQNDLQDLLQQSDKLSNDDINGEECVCRLIHNR